MTFDYLRDERPAAVEQAIRLTYQPDARAMASFAIVAALVLLGAWAIGASHVRAERRSLAQAQLRLAQTTAEASRIAVRARRVRALLELDRRLRRIKLSGAAFSRSLARLANALPLDAWLTQMTYEAPGYTLSGRAAGLSGVADALQAYPSVRLVGARRQEAQGARIVDFQAYVPDR